VLRITLHGVTKRVSAVFKRLNSFFLAAKDLELGRAAYQNITSHLTPYHSLQRWNAGKRIDRLQTN